MSEGSWRKFYRKQSFQARWIWDRLDTRRKLWVAEADRRADQTAIETKITEKEKTWN